MMRSKLIRIGKWVGIAAVGSSFLIFANFSTPWGPWCSSSVIAARSPEGAHAKWDYSWDKREPYNLIKPMKRNKSAVVDEETKNSLRSQKSKAVRHIILIRHGQYVMGGTTDLDNYLTPLGQEQAALTGERLKSLKIKFTSLLCSNMTRAIETTDIIKSKLDQPGLEVLAQDPMLREGDPIVPDPPVSYWTPEKYYFEDGPRIEAAFRKYFHRAPPEQCQDSYEIIVCHANVIRYFICRALQFAPEAWLRISLNHASLTILSILPSGRVVLKTAGESGHIPYNKITEVLQKYELVNLPPTGPEEQFKAHQLLLLALTTAYRSLANFLDCGILLD